MGMIATCPLFSIAAKLNLFSALCAAGSIWLIFQIVRGIKHTRTIEEGRFVFSPEKVQVISGIAAALYLLGTTPFWFIATRAHTLSFHIFFLLGVIYLLRAAARKKSYRLVCWVAFLCGIGAVEFSTFLLFVPVCAGIILIVMWLNQWLKVRLLLGGGLCFLAGLLVCLVAVWNFYKSPTYTWREFDGFFMVLRIFWRDQYYMAIKGIPKVGWMLILLTSVIPWLFVVPFSKTKGSTQVMSSVSGSYLLYGFLTILTILIWLNFPLAPWALLGFKRVVITPYLFVSTWTGYIVGYWYIILFGRRDGDAGPPVFLRRMTRPVFLLLIGLLAVGMFLGYSRIHGGYGRFVNSYVAEVVDALEGRDWFISGGLLNDLIALEAFERKQPLRILNPSWGPSSAYMNYVASLFEDPRLKTLTRIGWMPFMREWFSSLDVEQKTVLFTLTDMLTVHGYEAVPNAVCFVPLRGALSADAIDRLSRENRAFWREHPAEMMQGLNPKNILTPMIRHISAQLSKVANNTGVLLEDHGRFEEAFAAYTQSRRFNDRNISAFLNLYDLASKQERPELEALEKEFDDFIGNIKGQYDVWGLSFYHGYVRNPQAYTQLGWAWAVSGRPKVAIQQLQRAAATEGDTDRHQWSLAQLYLAAGQIAESEQVYLSLLQKNPGERSALLGLFRIALQQERYDEAAAYLKSLQEEADAEAYLFEEAVMEWMRGNRSAAQKFIL